ncbi:MAG TPA: hypothetical protein DEA75_11230 [Rhodobacteraceae bacterium]|jgi:hypothetical protein|nr:hypothetical protein [Paracoccaceae bacterium]
MDLNTIFVALGSVFRAHSALHCTGCSLAEAGPYLASFSNFLVHSIRLFTKNRELLNMGWM